MLPLECVVRGYITGSGWKDYLATGEVCGHVLPEGLTESDRLPQPLFTPSTKARQATTRTSAATRPPSSSATASRRWSAPPSTCTGSPQRTPSRAGSSCRHEIRARPRRRWRARARRRGVHSGFVPLLAGGSLRAGRAATIVRQAVRARLLRVGGLGQDVSGAGAAGTRRRRDAREVHRGVRTVDRHLFEEYVADPEVVLR
jgi:Phosphoribosylaminoimidazolesuccinocarboxamide (SAICAR) synthase